MKKSIVSINIRDLARELAEETMERNRKPGEVNTIEDEHGCIVYTDEAQDAFNELYDAYYDLILKCKE